MNHSKLMLFILLACVSPLKVATASNTAILFNSGLVINIEDGRRSCSIVATFEGQVIQTKQAHYHCFREEIESFSLRAQSKTP
ncbi:hypothetical protein [Vibrio splendidus]|uniref:hypothetical protein n=1 Tax=Vibrio splendidus TaxID=29497 RepID=UPI003D0C365A